MVDYQRYNVQRKFDVKVEDIYYTFYNAKINLRMGEFLNFAKYIYPITLMVLQVQFNIKIH